jgi:hypothetical protein
MEYVTVSLGERILMARIKCPVDHEEFFLVQWTAENEGIHPFEISATTHPTMQHHMPEDQNLQLHWCENPKTRECSSFRKEM